MDETDTAKRRIIEQPPCSPRLVLEAYRIGAFPMADSRDGPVRWYSPDPRAILPLDGFRISRSLRRRVKRGDYRITFDVAFEQVISACARPRPYSEDTWINDRIIQTYTALHQMGYAHSVEAWHQGGPDEPETLVGGLYGVGIGGAFFGESMFTRVVDASKVCLVHLVRHLRQLGFELLDSQIASEHMAQFGMIEIPRRFYLARLDRAIHSGVQWQPPQAVK